MYICINNKTLWQIRQDYSHKQARTYERKRKRNHSQDRERNQEKANKSRGTGYIRCVDQVPGTRNQ